MPSIVPVILCGGSGTRLWPLSRQTYPKQFIDLGDGRTLFGDTISRALRVLPPSGESGTGLKTEGATAAPRQIIVCNEAHRFYVKALLGEEAGNAAILLEPAPRNTAPAIALAALALVEGRIDPLMLVLPSDHMLGDDQAFVDSVTRAAPLAEEGRIMTFGITPTGPETGFGYIEQGDGFDVARFVEKPDAATARDMLARGGFLWNSGMFLVRASVYLEELARHAPEIEAACRASWQGRTVDGLFCRPDAAAFLASPADSIDYAVMEKTGRAGVMPLPSPWNDLGSWGAFYQAGPRDGDGNVCHGDIMTQDVEGCYLHARHGLVAAIGVRDLVVVETPDAVLVAPRDRAQEVKSIVERLEAQERIECRQHTVVQRPWGSYEAIACGPRFQVKRIIVDPGAELSLQMHHHRAEHWVVVQGTAEVTNGEEKRLYTENQSTYIPANTPHRLKNPGMIPLVLIEIQSGSYLGEDDIVRFADVYGREKDAKGS